MPHVIRKAGCEAGSLEGVRQKGHAGGGARGKKFEDLGHFDDGRGGDYSHTEGFGDGEVQAGRGRGVDV